MTAEVIVKGSEWVLSRETAEGAPEGIYGAQCLICGAESGLIDNDPRPIRAWTIEHTRQDSTHRQFRWSTERFCRVDPNPTPPLTEPEPRTIPVTLAEVATADRPPEARRHARRRTSRRRAVLAFLGRFAGPLLLVAIAAACGITVGILIATA